MKEVPMKPSLYILDVYAIVYRSYFAFLSRPLRNSSGRNVSAVYGFFRFLFSLFDQRKPDAFAAVFDSKGKTFRHEMYDAYKATRQKTPEDLIDQVPMVEEILAALKVPMLRAEGYEADDVIATIAKWSRREERDCYVVSGDKDLLQLVGGSVKALRPQEGFGFKELDSAEVEVEWGVGPDRILDYLSLTGDASDNIPGVRGIGDKTALKLLSQFRTVDGIYASLDSVKPDSLKAKLEAGREDAALSRKLITLADELPLGLTSLDELHVETLDRAAASAIFLREGMKSLAQGGVSGPAAESAPGLAAASLAAASQAVSIPATGKAARPAATATPIVKMPVRAEPKRKAMVGGLFDENDLDAAPAPSAPAAPPSLSPEDLKGDGTYLAVTTEEGLSSLVDACVAAGTFAFDTETDSVDAIVANIVGFSLSKTPKEAFYIPLKSPDSPTMPIDAAQRQLKRLFESKALIVGHNIKYDFHIMKRIGLTIGNRVFDTMIAAWIIDAESNSFSLESLSERLLGLSGLSFEAVVEKGKTFDSVPIATATRYASEDADFTLRLHLLLDEELEREKLKDIFKYMEMPLIPVLAEMEEKGIVVNAGELRKYGVELEAELRDIEKKVWELVGHDFNLASTKQLQEVLFVERKLPPQKRTKTGYSTDTTVLEELAPLDPVPQLILRQRMLAKLKNTYVDTLAELAERTPSGRVHTTYIQTGAATGRLSSKDPNLQNIPIRDEEGRRIRASFTAAPGQRLISADYSQIELVVMAHLSGDANLIAAFKEGVDIHKRTAAFIFGIDEAAVTPEHRRVAKTINFGVIYGMSAFRLARDLGIPNVKAQGFIDAYFTTYSGVAGFIQKTIAETEASGYSTTMFGRRRKIDAINSRNKTERQAAQRVAVNTPIQGTAADIVKRAMLLVDATLREKMPEVTMLLQVHDELVFEAPEASVDAACVIIRKEMEAAAELSIPLRVSMESAYSWGDMH
ncbi:MAG TPA: DNA polymerase I [Rectinemataceae bacterium]|nr:DNA polymerase I [Rectinemataceae bacterium]